MFCTEYEKHFPSIVDSDVKRQKDIMKTNRFVYQSERTRKIPGFLNSDVT